MIIDKKVLLNAIKSDIEIIAVWGAYQILRLDEKQIEDYLPLFLASPIVDIQDAGLAKISEIGLEDYTTEIIRIFRESDGQLKYTAASALSNFPNDISNTLIQKWFERLVVSDQSTRIELEAATYSYLKINREKGFQLVLNALISFQPEVIKSSILFINLLTVCTTENEYNSIIDQYFILRDTHSDAELTYHLIDNVIDPELKKWWADNLARGYSISSIYERCYSLLDREDNIADCHFRQEIEESFGYSGKIHKGTPDNHKVFIETVRKWVEQLLNENEKPIELLKLKYLLDGFERNERYFQNTIPKIIEMESCLLLSIPVKIILEQSISKWLKRPAQFVENIASYYHSTIVIKTHSEEILNTFFSQVPDWSEEQVKITNPEPPTTLGRKKNEILWSFFSGDLLGYDIPWPSIFPNPGYSPRISTGLARIYFLNFSFYFKKNDRISIDYALQLFQLHPDKNIVSLLASHFEYLSHFHADILYQTIEYLPDPVFIDLLGNKYQKGEYEIARLIYLISGIFKLSIPENIIHDLNNMEDMYYRNSGMTRLVRLYCPNCDNTFQYPVDMIYVDEGSMLRMNELSENSVWVPKIFNCKKCDSVVPFVLDDFQLKELSLQSRVDHILKITPGTKDNISGYKISLIDFPKYNGVTYTPIEFSRFIRDYEKGPAPDSDELRTLFMIQARLEKSMCDWKACKKVLEKIKSLEKIDEEWMFIMGFVNYKLLLHADARKYFNWIINKHPEGAINVSRKLFVEQSKYFLKTMDSNASKRARLKVVKKKT